jgi:hypothetical protein
MADLNNFAVLPGPAANLNVPTKVITGTINEGAEIIADYTGDNAINFPQILSTLDEEHFTQLMDLIADKLVFWKAGLER